MTDDKILTDLIPHMRRICFVAERMIAAAEYELRAIVADVGRARGGECRQ